MPNHTILLIGTPVAGGNTLALVGGTASGFGTVVGLNYFPAGGPGELTPSFAPTGNPLTDGAMLQTKLDQAAIGDVIVLKAGVTYQTNNVNGFTFQPKGASWNNQRVILRSSQQPNLPAGTRVTPNDALKLAKLVTGVKGPTLNFAGSRGWQLEGIEATYTTALQTGSNSGLLIVNLNGAGDDLTFDRCWIHPLESVTAPNSRQIAVPQAISTNSCRNLKILASRIDGFAGRGYDGLPGDGNGTIAFVCTGGGHIRIKNSFLQSYWKLLNIDPGTTSDLIVQASTLDCPALWNTWGMQDDHRHVLIYALDGGLLVGNSLTGEGPGGHLGHGGKIGLFLQGNAPQTIRNVRFLSNFVDQGDCEVAKLQLFHSSGSGPHGHDVAFVNHLIRGGPWYNGQVTSFSESEFGGPAGILETGQAVSAGHGINFLHCTLRGLLRDLINPQGVPSEWLDMRYNITNSGDYWILTLTSQAVDYPNILVSGNRFVAVPSGNLQPRPAFIPAGDVAGTSDAAIGFVDAAGADAGGPITGYALAASSPHKGSADYAQDPGVDIPALQAALAGTSTDYDYPELPRVFLDTTYAPPTGGLTRPVTAGSAASLQQAIDLANPGDIITVPAGSTYVGNFILRDKGASTQWIYIRSVNYGSLPAPGTRVTPSDAVNMPKIVTNNSDPAIWGVGHHYRLVGLEIASTSGNTFDIVRLDSFDRSLAAQPHDLTIDRCYIHGVDLNRRGVTMDCVNGAVIDSWIMDIKSSARDDCQAITCIQGRNIRVTNNHLEAPGENMICGGGDPAFPQMVPADIEVRNNHFFKNPAWDPSDPAWGGVAYAVKNFFELKNAQRVLCEGNLFENFWRADQDMAITFTPRNSNYTAPWSRVVDVTFRRNKFKNLHWIPTGLVGTWGGDPGLMVITADDNENFPSPNQGTQRTARILVQHNDFGYVPGQLFRMMAGPQFGGPDHLVIDHNTAINGTHLLYFVGGGAAGIDCSDFVFTNNVFPQTANGVILEGFSGTATQVLNASAPRYTFRNNIIVGNASGFPPLTMPKATLAAVGFIDLNGGNYQLSSSSTGYRAGWDGTTLGFEP